MFGLTIDSAEQTLWGESADDVVAARLDAPLHTPLLVFRRVASAAGRPIEYVVSRYRGDRYQIHMSLGRDSDPSPTRSAINRKPVTTERNGSEHSRCNLGRCRRRPETQPRTSTEVRPQPDAADRRAAGRGPAAPARPARPARRRRPRLGPGLVRRRRRRQRALRQPADHLRGRHRDRHGQEGGRLDRARRGGRLPRLQGGRRRDVAVHPRDAGGRRAAGADQLRRARRHRDGPDHRLPLAALPPDQAAGVPGLLRWPSLRPDHHLAGRDRRSRC